MSSSSITDAAAADAGTKCTNDSQQNLQLQKDGVGELEESLDEGGVIYGQDMNERIGPGFVSLNQAVLEKLQNNDPSVTKLYLFFDDDVEDDVAGNTDWEEEGYCTFGNNTHLKAVHILVDCYQWGPNSLKNFVALYEAIASNRSIQHLSLSGSLLNHNVYSSSCTGEARTFSLLKPLFKNNNLHSFDLWELATNLRGEAKSLTTKKLVDVLSCCGESSMRNLNIRARGVDEDVVASGEWLTRHRNLKKLALNLGSSTFGRGLCTALESLLTNSDSTLEYFVLDGSVIDDEGATILGNALGRSKSLKKFYLIESDGGFEMSQNGWSELSRGLMNSESSLNTVTLNSVLKSSRRKYENKEFIDVEVLRPEDTTLIGTALSSVSTLKSLDLRDNSLSSNHWGVFLRGLLAGNSSLVKLMLGGNDLGDDGLVALGDMLLGNNSLKMLSLEGHRKEAKAASWAAFSKGLAQSSIEMLNLSKSNIDNEALATLGSNTTLKRLDLKGIRSVDTTGWQKFFGLLSNSASASKLEELSFSFNSVGNEGVPLMVDALSSISSLTKLHLANQYGKEDISNSSWSTFSGLLGKSSLVTLSIEDGVNEEVKTCLASELANGSTLQTLILGGYSVTKGLGVLENVLCNKTSIDSLYTSNHTLQEVLEISKYAANGTRKVKGLPGEINELMELNKNTIKSEVARQKILRYHFFKGGDVNDMDAKVLFDMELGVMPQVVAWIGKDAVGFPLLHRLIRGMPSLCDYRGNAALVEAERKKRKV